MSFPPSLLCLSADCRRGGTQQGAFAGGGGVTPVRWRLAGLAEDLDSHQTARDAGAQLTSPRSDSLKRRLEKERKIQRHFSHLLLLIITTIISAEPSATYTTFHSFNSLQNNPTPLPLLQSSPVGGGDKLNSSATGGGGGSLQLPEGE